MYHTPVFVIYLHNHSLVDDNNHLKIITKKKNSNLANIGIRSRIDKGNSRWGATNLYVEK